MGRRFAFLLSALVLLIPADTEAQTPSEPPPPPAARPYLLGGWSLQMREGATDRINANGFTFGFGVPIRPTIAVEGTVSFYTGSSLNWYYGYLSGSQGDRRTSEHDGPFAFQLRWRQPCQGRTCADFVGGGGFNVHTVSTRTLTNCRYVGSALVCQPVDAPADGSSVWEPLLTGGIDVRIRASEHIDIAPGGSVTYIWRSEYLTTANFRGPKNVGSASASFHVHLIWKIPF